MRGRIVFLMLVLLLTSCEGESQPPNGTRQAPAEFEFVSSWEPSIEKRNYVTFVDYSLKLRNIGGQPGIATCDVLFRNEPLQGWSEGDEIPVATEGLVSGRALLAQHVDPGKVVTQLEPRCREAANDEPLHPVVKRFFGKEGDKAYFDLRRRGLKVRFGSEVSRSQRLNMRGHQSHPEVVITALEHDRDTDTVTIIDLDCVGREADLC